MNHGQTEHGSLGTSSSPARILPLLSGEGNQRLLFEWIQNQDHYTLVEPDQPLGTAEFDCCILDAERLEEHAEKLRHRKREVEPILLPCLLLLPEEDLSVIDVDRGEIADSVVFEAVDEVVSMPIKKAELEWRTEALLRLRSQSLNLDRRRRELRLFKQAAEAAGHAVYIVDSDGTIEYANPAFEEITGYDATDVIGERPEILDSGEMSDSYFDRLWETISSGESWEEDIVNRRKDGEIYHANQTIAPVTDENGTPVKYVAIQSDVTQRVETKQRLEMFRDIVERLEDPIMLQDPEGRFRLVNEALTEYAELSREELLGKTEFAFMDEEAATRIEAHKKQVLETEQPIQYTISPTFPTEDAEIFSTTRYPYYGTDGTLEGTIAICRVVTDLKSRERQLHVLDRVLRHNLRNDMTTIGMFAEKLREEISDELVADVERIQKTARNVDRMVEKQRKITKFLTDTPKERTIDLSETVNAIVERKQNRYPGAEIRAQTPGSCTVETTPDLDRAIIELVENAVEHSDQETPTVEVRVCDDTDRPTVAVADEGPGISEVDRQILLGEQETDQLYHGSGLGLWLVYLIVEKIGGGITVTENEPRGSVVTLQLFDQ
ncbi:MAG: PAS domain S-box protein [Natronomonas sp.]